MAALSEVDLKKLTTLNGDLELHPASSAAPLSMLTALDLPQLVEVDGSVELALDAARSVELPRLKSVAGDLAIRSSPVLATSSLPRLSGIGGTLAVSGTKLGTLDVPVLESIGSDLVVDNNPALRVVRLPELRTVGGNFDFHQNHALADCRARAVSSQLVDFTGTTTIDNDNAREGPEACE